MKKMMFTIIVIFISLTGNSQYRSNIHVESILKTDTTTIGQGFIYPDTQKDEITISRITIQPGESTGWHKHEFPVFAYILKGNLTVESENHKLMEFSENTSFSEVINTYHNGMNNGKENVILIAFYLGEKGKPLSVQK